MNPSVSRPEPGVTSEDPLALDPDTMRALGYRVIDMLVDGAEPDG